MHGDEGERDGDERRAPKRPLTLACRITRTKIAVKTTSMRNAVPLPSAPERSPSPSPRAWLVAMSEDERGEDPAGELRAQ